MKQSSTSNNRMLVSSISTNHTWTASWYSGHTSQISIIISL